MWVLEHLSSNALRNKQRRTSSITNHIPRICRIQDLIKRHSEHSLDRLTVDIFKTQCLCDEASEWNEDHSAALRTKRHTTDGNSVNVAARIQNRAWKYNMFHSRVALRLWSTPKNITDSNTKSSMKLIVMLNVNPFVPLITQAFRDGDHKMWPWTVYHISVEIYGSKWKFNPCESYG